MAVLNVKIIIIVVKSKEKDVVQPHQQLNRELIISRCKRLLEKLDFDITNIEYVFDEYGSLELKNIDLKISDASYLSYKLGVKVYISTNNIVKTTYNSTLNGARPLVLKAGEK